MPVAVPITERRINRPEANKSKYGLEPYEIVMTNSGFSLATATNPYTNTARSFTPSSHTEKHRPSAHGLDYLHQATMHRNGHVAMMDGLPNHHRNAISPPFSPAPASTSKIAVAWDWDVEHDDRKREARADAALHGTQPFQVDRRLLKDVVREKMGTDVGRITFLSAGTFHKAYLVTLVDTRELVARVARRFMPRLKTESEVATLKYLREKTSIPVPFVYHYDANPYNRLGGEYILMSKAPGIPLSKVYHTMSNDELRRLFSSVASLIIPLFSQRFTHLGSLYLDSSPSTSALSSGAPTPTATHSTTIKGFSFMPLLSMTSSSSIPTPKPAAKPPSQIPAAPGFNVGSIISWPFFGSNRGDLSHPSEINRGPWSSTQAYLESCVEREISGVVRENEGKSAPHRLHLDPNDIHSSRHHHLRAVPDDKSDDSDEWDLEESEEEWEGPGDAMYRDYRRMQRSTFLVSHMMRREDCVRQEMGRWMKMMQRLGSSTDPATTEEFGLDCHDLSLENVFVDEHDHTKITCVIDWESTTTRPLWACAHLPAFLQSSPFTARLFREAVAQLAESPASSSSQHPVKKSKHADLAVVAKEWLHYEAIGARLRLAHRCAEWDGWEEGLVDSILGSEDTEEDWFKDADPTVEESGLLSPSMRGDFASESEASHSGSGSGSLLVSSLKKRKQAGRIPLKKEGEREQMLDMTGDICGGRGGELGRRLEAWLSVDGNGERRGSSGSEDEYDAEAE